MSTTRSQGVQILTVVLAPLSSGPDNSAQRRLARMLLPWRGMPSRSPRRVLRLALLLAPLVTACTGWPADDLGDAWVSGAPTQKIRWLTWSPDATKLYWIGGPAGTLYAMAAADRQPVALATVGSYPPPALTEGREIFYTTEDPATGSLNLTLATLGSEDRKSTR